MSASKSQQNLSSRYSNSSNNSGMNRGSGKSSKTIIIMLLALVCIIGVVVIVFSDKGQNIDANAYNLVVTPDNIEELKQANGNATLAAGSYDVCMNSTWTFKNARSASSNAYVENVLSNTNTVKFSLTRNDTGQLIYESPYIPVGSSLRNIKLSDESLKSGTYPCTIQYHLVDENYQNVSSVKVSLSVVIKED